MTPLSLSQLLALAFAVACTTNALPHKRAAVDNTQLLHDLEADPSAIAKFQRLFVKNGDLLSGEELTKATVFDFNERGFSVPGSNGGTVASANPLTFPLLTTTSLNINSVTVGPCGVLAPHVHPRANEFFLVTSGSASFGYVLETGLLVPGTPDPEIRGTLGKNVGTLFPQGSVHWQVNDSEDCSGFEAVVVLDSRDPGTTPILLGRDDVEKTQDDGDDLGGLRAVLPERIVEVVDGCRVRCRLA